MAGTTEPGPSGASPAPEAPLVSVVLPAHNEEALVSTALRSVAAQSYPAQEIEAIVVNNGSQDRTGEIVEAAAQELAPLTVRIVHDPRRGIARAKNLGGRAARGRYLVFMDADSWMSPGLVQRIVGRAASGERAASIRVVADSTDLLDRAFFDLMEWGKRLFGIRANMAWMERVLFDELGGFDEALNQAEDLDLLTRARRQGVAVGHVADERIATSARRLHRGPLRLGLLRMFARWALGNFGIGRRWPY